MAGNKHVLFAVTTCLGSAAVMFAMRTKVQVSRDLQVEHDSTLPDVHDHPLQIADKSVNDHADLENSLPDQRPIMSPLHVRHHDVKIEEDVAKSDVHLPTIEEAAEPVDFRHTDIPQPGVVHTSNGVHQISSTLSTHKAQRNISFLDAAHRTFTNDVQCAYSRHYKGKKSGLKYHVEECEAYNEADVRYVSQESYGRNSMSDRSYNNLNAYLRMDIGDNQYLFEIDWKPWFHLGCFETNSQQTCKSLLQLADRTKTSYSQHEESNLRLCCELF